MMDDIRMPRIRMSWAVKTRVHVIASALSRDLLLRKTVRVVNMRSTETGGKFVDI